MTCYQEGRAALYLGAGVYRLSGALQISNETRGDELRAECDRTYNVTTINGQNPGMVSGWDRETDIGRCLLCVVDG